jgi:glutathione synthase/RimK-type ligase-like ATP-grasp enzyme
MKINIKCISKACDELNIKYNYVDKFKDVLVIESNPKKYFIQTATPFNSEDVMRICRDKDYTYQILKNDINTPKTLSFLDPFCNPIYKDYIKEKSYDEVVNQITEVFDFPLVLKKNSGSMGENVFKCETKESLQKALNIIFDQSSKHYDYIMLAQEYISIAKEYRVIVFEKEVILLYEKNTDQATFIGNLSPLHWENSKAILVTDDILIKKITDFIKPIYKSLNIVYGGLDVAIDESGKSWLIEINSKPGFDIFVKDNGEEPLVEMYTEILKSYLI